MPLFDTMINGFKNEVQIHQQAAGQSQKKKSDVCGKKEKSPTIQSLAAMTGNCTLSDTVTACSNSLRKTKSQTFEIKNEDCFSFKKQTNELCANQNNNNYPDQVTSSGRCQKKNVCKKASETSNALYNIAKQSCAYDAPNPDRKLKTIDEYRNGCNYDCGSPVRDYRLQWCDDCDKEVRYCLCKSSDNDASMINKYRHAHKRLTSLNRDASKNNKGCVNILSYLHGLQKCSKLCDLAFKIEDRVYLAHKVAFTYHSEKYRERFEKADCKDEKKYKNDGTVFTINLCKTTDNALKAILHYIYTCDIDINPSNADNILKAATELEMKELRERAQMYLNQLSLCTVLRYLTRVIDKNDGSHIMYKIYRYIMGNLNKISVMPEFLRASLCTVKAILSDSKLCVASEMEIFDAAMNWLNYDRHGRMNCTAELLKCVRFTHMSPPDLHNKTLAYPILIENKELEQMILDAFKYHAFQCCKDVAYRNLVKREENRGADINHASIPEAFVNAIRELADIAERLEAEHKKMIKYPYMCPKQPVKQTYQCKGYPAHSITCCLKPAKPEMLFDMDCKKNDTSTQTAVFEAVDDGFQRYYKKRNRNRHNNMLNSDRSSSSSNESI